MTDKLSDREIWEDIPGYVGHYQASNMGNIKSLRRKYRRKEKPLAQIKCAMYLSVNLCINNIATPTHVHRLILLAFSGPCPDGMEACHNDGDSANNKITNLRWDTPKNNQKDRIAHGTSCHGRGHSEETKRKMSLARRKDEHPCAKLTYKKVSKIRGMHACGNYSSHRLAEIFNVSRSIIWAVVNNKSWV